MMCEKRKQSGWLKRREAQFLLMLGLLWTSMAQAGVFEFAGDVNGVDVIAHPPGYVGRGEALVVTVGISPTSPHAADMEMPIQNAINAWNQLVPTTGNVKIDGNILPSHMFDFESVALHELGHCIGLAHPNLATESGLNGDDKNFTSATRGANHRFDLNRGTDGIIGSNDDLRGDDINLHWFNKAHNNPFVLAEVIDHTTYSRELADLPAGHQFAANGDRAVSLLNGFGLTEAVMQQGILAGEARRSLTADDIATLRLGMSGLDGREGTADDYTLVLQYIGLADDADIVFAFDNMAAFAACRVTGFFLRENHIVVQTGRISFNTAFVWYFNQQPVPAVPDQPVVSIEINNQSEDRIVLQAGDHLSLTIALDPGRRAGNQADYWVKATTPVGDFWLNNQLRFIRSDTPIRAHGGPLFEFPFSSILESETAGLPIGDYTFTFAVDNNLDQIYDETYQSSVSLTLQP